MKRIFISIAAMMVIGLSLLGCASQPDETLASVVSVVSMQGNAVQSTAYSTPESQTQLEVLDGCIQPIDTFSYSFYIDSTKPNPGSTNIVYPSYPWQLVTQLEVEKEYKNAEWRSSRIMGIREVGRNYEIWIRNEYWYDVPAAMYTTFSIFHPDTGQVEPTTIHLSNEESDVTIIDKLFIDENGSVWGIIRSIETDVQLKSQISILTKFNDVTNSFDYDYRAARISLYSEDLIPYTRALFDDQETIWFFVPGDSVYSFNLTTGLIQKTISISDFEVIEDVFPGPESSMVFIGGKNTDAEMIMKYVPDTGEVSTIGIPYNIQIEYFPTHILYDSEENLWLDSYAWMSPTEEWTIMFPSETFITNYPGNSGYRLIYPKIQAETSDKRLWFTSDNGAYWLDRDLQKWCWFTTYYATPVEDPDGNLWLVAGDELYRADVNAR